MGSQGVSLLEYTQLVASHYNEEAPSYDSVYTSGVQAAEDRVVMALIAPYVTDGQKVLDLGCGTGLPLNYLSIGGYLGIDVSSGMIDQAKKDHPSQQFKVGDMHHLTLPDESRDTVVSLFGPLSYSLQPEQVVAELWRVLEPGGTAVVMPYSTRVGHGLEMGGYSTADAADIPKTYYDGESLSSLFSRCGFTVLKVLGINYFGNTLERFATELGGELSQEQLVQLLMHEVECADRMPDPKYARHIMVVARKPGVKS